MVLIFLGSFVIELIEEKYAFSVVRCEKNDPDPYIIQTVSLTGMTALHTNAFESIMICFCCVLEALIRVELLERPVELSKLSTVFMTLLQRSCEAEG